MNRSRAKEAQVQEVNDEEAEDQDFREAQRCRFDKSAGLVPDR
jgi:hypothetical protein